MTGITNIKAGDISQAYVTLGTGLRAPYLKVRQIAGITGLPFAEVSRQLLTESSRLRPSQRWLDLTPSEQIGALLKAQQTAQTATAGGVS